MKIQRPQAAVAWIPSRHRHALFRLVAFVRLTQTPPEQCVLDETKVLAIDRDQSTAETYVVTALTWFTVTCFAAHWMSAIMHILAAAVLAIPVAAFAITFAIPITGIFITPLLHVIGLPRGPHNINVTSTILLLVLAIAASWFALFETWVRLPAWIFLGCIAANGLAAIVLFILRKRVREAEARCVA